jgi:hypothetical protein
MEKKSPRIKMLLTPAKWQNEPAWPSPPCISMKAKG